MLCRFCLGSFWSNPISNKINSLHMHGLKKAEKGRTKEVKQKRKGKYEKRKKVIGNKGVMAGHEPTVTSNRFPSSVYLLERRKREKGMKEKRQQRNNMKERMKEKLK